MALVVLTIAGCSTNASSELFTSTLAGVEAPKLLSFSAKTVDGKDFSGSSLVGNRTLLWFWAPWCPVCQREAPDVEKATTTAAGIGVTFVGVAAQDQLPAMRDFVRKYHLTFPQLADTDAKVWALYGVTRQPAFAFVDSTGKVDLVKGALSGENLEKRLSQLR
ncbi:redoxin domain-containing protein [Mycobacteroides abscessus]|uniref:redoxin domain-containing protein n=1 Tax=Mycobacteroides abscessus TaxID=36809 RepID=UPI0009A89507|nr:redoxin domain-containing protein [Mycobacteroides abscessus]SLF47545.1 Probable conserved lipoprotein DsbF [Mycobacteroides abscessus subsp. abscessus]